MGLPKAVKAKSGKSVEMPRRRNARIKIIRAGMRSRCQRTGGQTHGRGRKPRPHHDVRQLAHMAAGTAQTEPHRVLSRRLENPKIMGIIVAARIKGEYALVVSESEKEQLHE